MNFPSEFLRPWLLPRGVGSSPQDDLLPWLHRTLGSLRASLLPHQKMSQGLVLSYPQIHLPTPSIREALIPFGKMAVEASRLYEMHNLKFEDYVSFEDLTEDYSLGISLSNSSEELFQRGEGGASPLWNSVRSISERKTKQNKTHVVKHQKITANHTHTKPDISINDFSA